MNGWRTPTKRSSAPMNSSRSMSEQLAKIEGDTPRPSCGRTCPAIAARASGRAAAHAGITCANTPAARIASEAGVRSPMALLLAACFVVTALVLSAYGGGIVTRWAPQLGSNAIVAPKVQRLPRSPRHPSFRWPSGGDSAASGSIRGSIAADNATAGNIPGSGRRPRRRMPRDLPSRRQQLRRQPPLRLLIKPQLLQKIARDLATLERNIEQLKANQQQMAS